MKKLKSDDIQLKFDKVCDDVMEGKRRKHALKEHKLTIKKFRELLQDPVNTEKWNTSLKEHAYCLWEKIQDILENEDGMHWQERKIKIELYTKFVSFFDKDLFAPANKTVRDQVKEETSDALGDLILSIQKKNG